MAPFSLRRKTTENLRIGKKTFPEELLFEKQVLLGTGEIYF